MTNVLDHVERLRGHPHHVRKQIAVGTALGISVVIGVIWLGVSLATGAWHIQGTSFADATAPKGVVVAGGDSSNADNLAGAAASLPAYSNAGPSIQIVDAPAPKPAQPEPTVIPF